MQENFYVSDNFTRPADTTAYAAGDLVANSTTAGSVVPLTFKIAQSRNIDLYGAKIMKSSATNTNATFTLHLYKNSPTCTNGDNGAWLTTESNYIGSLPVNCSTYTFSDDAAGVGYTIVNDYSGWPWMIDMPVNNTIYGLLEVEAAYTPASAEVFTVSLFGEAH